ncbi:MAG: hypothetical protein DWQ37_07900 [Planctomycetota bacterium]|nr:MAG: hypothetical protein DWQ37_07900 [Planctomycetota bacterium]
MHTRLTGLLLTGVLATWLASSPATADEWYQINERALATFDFEGSALPADVEQLKQQFPQARPDPDRITKAAGLECYVVDGLKHADEARFYFYEGRLYQFEATYDLDRVRKMGGAQAVLQQLVDRWGPVDQVGEWRWTWQRPVYSRRADFYAWPKKNAQLTITDMSWMPVVERRTSRADSEQSIDLGF